MQYFISFLVVDIFRNLATIDCVSNGCQFCSYKTHSAQAALALASGQGLEFIKNETATLPGCDGPKNLIKADGFCTEQEPYCVLAFTADTYMPLFKSCGTVALFRHGSEEPVVRQFGNLFCGNATDKLGVCMCNTDGCNADIQIPEDYKPGQTAVDPSASTDEPEPTDETIDESTDESTDATSGVSDRCPENLVYALLVLVALYMATTHS